MLDSETLKSNCDVNVSPLAVLAIVIGVLASLARAYIWSRGNMNGEAIGYAVGGMLLSFLIAYAFAGRKKVRNRNKFGAIFCAFSLFTLLLELNARR